MRKARTRNLPNLMMALVPLELLIQWMTATALGVTPPQTASWGDIVKGVVDKIFKS
jgi:hypothetical protein